MSIPSRFIDLCEPAADANTRHLTGAPDHDGWLPLDRAAHVSALLHATAKRVRLVFDQARPNLTPLCADTPLATSTSLSIPIVRAALCAAAADLAHVVNGARPEQWTLTAEQEHRTITAETLLRDALTHAAHHLHALEERSCRTPIRECAPDELHARRVREAASFPGVLTPGGATST
jgi:hypothetical protein